MTALATAAQRLGQAGCFVFPIKPRAKTPITAHGCDDATHDPEQIAEWWRQSPSANIGVACGPTGIVAIDLDGPQGVAHWRRLVAEQPTPHTLTSRTGTGWHLWYIAPTDRRRLGNSASKIAAKIDSRGLGGYILVPPSVHPNGHRYAWAAHQPAAMAVLPAWCVDLLDPPAGPRPVPRWPTHEDKYAATALAREIDELRAAPVGRRNDSLCRAAFSLGQLTAAGRLDRRVVLAELLTAAQGIGLGDREAERTAISGLSAGANHPRAAA